MKDRKQIVFYHFGQCLYKWYFYWVVQGMMRTILEGNGEFSIIDVVLILLI